MDVQDNTEAEIERWVGDPKRLAVIHRIGLLDSPPEETFDMMTRLAAKLVNAPASFLAIVDDHRDFYKSQCGLPPALATSRQLGGRTFCHYTLERSEPLIIEDTLADSLWRTVPTVKSLGVRAYIGVPVIIDGQHVGSFCVIDMQPRQWSATEIDTVTEIGRSAGREVLLRDKVRDAEAKAQSAAAFAKRNAELLVIVAHDLRTPLQVVGLTTALLKRMVDPKTAPQLSRLETAADAMTGIVDSLLENHAVGSRAVKLPVVISASQLLVDAAETVITVAEHADIKIAIGQATVSRVEVDFAALLRVFANLLGNCVKYCPAGSTVLLTATDSGNDVIFRVADDGPGMVAADEAKAFDRGWQGEAKADGKQGAGLGLSIVRELVEKNGGQVTFDGDAGKGTTVVVTLPRHSAG